MSKRSLELWLLARPPSRLWLHQHPLHVHVMWHILWHAANDAYKCEHIRGSQKTLVKQPRLDTQLLCSSIYNWRAVVHNKLIGFSADCRCTMWLQRFIILTLTWTVFVCPLIQNVKGGYRCFVCDVFIWQGCDRKTNVWRDVWHIHDLPSILSRVNY